MNSNKKRILAITLIFLGGGYLLIDLLPTGSSSGHSKSSSHQSSGQGVITQNVIKETTVIKAPDVMKVEPLPVPTEDDYEFLRRVTAKEAAQHATEMATINAAKAQALLDEKKAKDELEGKSAINQITNGAVPVAAQKASSLNIGVSEKTSAESHKDFIKNLERKKASAFTGMSIASISTTENGTDVWIKFNNGLFHPTVGQEFNGYKMISANENNVVIRQLGSGFTKTFQLTSISYPKRESSLEDTLAKKSSEQKVASIKPSSYESIKKRLRND